MSRNGDPHLWQAPTAGVASTVSGGRSRPQYRQTTASRLMISAQKGHFRLSPARSFLWSIAWASDFMSSACGRATMNRAAPYSHHATKLRPLDWAMAAGIRPITTAITNSSICPRVARTASRVWKSGTRRRTLPLDRGLVRVPVVQRSQDSGKERLRLPPRRRRSSRGAGHADPLGREARNHGRTRKAMLLDSAPSGVTTWTVPVVAPVGTVVVTREGERTVKVAAAPLKVTLVAPVRFVPRILTLAPTLPDVGRVFTNGPSPMDSLNTVPSPRLGDVPPKVVP